MGSVRGGGGGLGNGVKNSSISTFNFIMTVPLFYFALSSFHEFMKHPQTVKMLDGWILSLLPFQHFPPFLFSRRLGVEMGKVQVYQEPNRGELSWTCVTFIFS